MIIHMSVKDLISLILVAVAFLYFIGLLIFAKVINYRSKVKEKKHAKRIQK